MFGRCRPDSRLIGDNNKILALISRTRHAALLIGLCCGVVLLNSTVVEAQGSPTPVMTARQDQSARQQNPTLERRLKDLRASGRNNASPVAPDILRDRAISLAADFLAQRDVSKAGLTMVEASTFATRAGDPQRGIALASDALTRCRSAKDLACEGRALVTRGIALRRLGDHEAALDDYRLAAEVFERIGDSAAASRVLLNAANAQSDIGDTDGAIATYRRIQVDQADIPLRYIATLNEAILLLDRGRHREALPVAERAVAMRREGGKFVFLNDPTCSAVNTLGRIKAHLGDASGLSGLGECVRKAQQASNTPEIYMTAGSMADALLALERPREALPFINLALASKAGNPPQDSARLYHLAALIYAANGQRDVALEMADKAYQVARQTNESMRSNVIASALARTSLAERDALLEVTRARAALERTRSARRIEQFRWIIGTIAGLAIISVLGLIVLFRARQNRARAEGAIAERTRMARDLHDTLLQSFSGLAMELRAAAISAPSTGGTQTATRLADLANKASTSLAEARDAVWRFRLPMSGGLLPTIEAWIESQRLNTSVELSVSTSGPLPDLGDERSEHLLRVVQEAVGNALRHGQPSRIDVRFRPESGGIRLEIRDDGRGFVPDGEYAGTGNHWGLLGMRERIARVGGTFTVESAPDAGTTVAALIPA